MYCRKLPADILAEHLTAWGGTKADLEAATGIRVQRINEWLRGAREPRWSAVVTLLEAMGYRVEVKRNGTHRAQQ